MATLADIARKTGLAVTTVSEVLRGKAGYSDATRRQVRAAAQHLRYRPNHIGRALKGGPTMTLGVMFEGMAASASLARVAAIEEAAGQNGYLTFFTRPTARALEGLLDRRVDGIIISSLLPHADELAPILRQSPMPAVYLDGAPAGERRAVHIDRETGIRQLVAHLAELGHRRAAYIASPSDWHTVGHRLAPYQRAMAGAGVEFHADRQWTIDPEQGVPQSAYQVVSRFLKTRGPCTALVMKNDEAALAALAAAHDAGVRVPENLSVVGFDDVDEAAFCRPAITTVSQPRAEAGRAAFEMLHQLMQSPQTAVEKRVFKCQLVVRASTGPAAARTVRKKPRARQAEITSV